jgi:hypothetical protein
MSDFENELSNISHLRCFKIFDKDKSHILQQKSMTFLTEPTYIYLY